jgi:hypothetical protein
VFFAFRPVSRADLFEDEAPRLDRFAKAVLLETRAIKMSSRIAVRVFFGVFNQWVIKQVLASGKFS